MAEQERVLVELTVNDYTHQLQLEPRRSLLEALRIDLGLTGTKQVCNMGNCGACTVLEDGRPVYSCLRLAVDCGGHTIQTIESLNQDGTLDPLQQAFIAHDALQCGFCTPGQIMAARGLLAQNPHPTEAEVVEGMSGNLCRCGAYRGIVAAVLAASQAHA